MEETLEDLGVAMAGATEIETMDIKEEMMIAVKAVDLEVLETIKDATNVMRQATSQKCALIKDLNLCMAVIDEAASDLPACVEVVPEEDHLLIEGPICRIEIEIYATLYTI